MVSGDNQLIGAVIDFLGIGDFNDLKDPFILGLLSLIVAVAVTMYFLVTAIRVTGTSKKYLKVITIFSAIVTFAILSGVMYRRTRIPIYNYVYEGLYSAAFVVLLYATWFFYKLAMENKQIKDFAE